MLYNTKRCETELNRFILTLSKFLHLPASCIYFARIVNETMRILSTVLLTGDPCWFHPIINVTVLIVLEFTNFLVGT
jgi:hypothetical protein